jgi:hypothetical protein
MSARRKIGHSGGGLRIFSTSIFTNNSMMMFRRVLGTILPCPAFLPFL